MKIAKCGGQIAEGGFSRIWGSNYLSLLDGSFAWRRINLTLA
jgi:hypothetical protein